MNKENSIYTSFSVDKIVDETSGARSFELKPSGDIHIFYEAGQFITLVFGKGDKEERRSYSFSSAPVLNEPLRITVKHVANGEYSRWLLSHVKKGDILTSSGISGFFRLPKEIKPVQQFVFLAAGSGITPVFSLLKTLLYASGAQVVLLYSNHSEEETIFYTALTDLKNKFAERLTIEFIFSHSDKHKRRLSKWLLTSLLSQYNIPLKQTLFYLCGPADYMLIAGISLITAGVPPENIKKESFNTRKHIIKPVPPDTDPHKVKLVINNYDYEFIVHYPDTILSAAKKLNIHLPYSCEAGNCGSCTATCVSGKTWMAYNEVLTDEEIRNGKVLTCQGYPVEGDIALIF
jgi:ring-1,2-phenylacetyl-CoA epoxidase subunit PaaE